MAKKKGNESNFEGIDVQSQDFFNELCKDTGFELVTENEVMNGRDKTPTPFYVLNCILGGGLPLGIQAEIAGNPASGKSTFSYASAGDFLRKYPNGVVAVLDLEDSLDLIRLQQLGVDTKRVLRLPSISLENAFENLFKILKKMASAKEASKEDLKLFVIYDSLDAGGTDKQHSQIEQGGSAFGFGGGMMEKPRLLKANTGAVPRYLEDIDAVILYLNQISTQGIGGYVTTTESRRWTWS